MDINELHKRCDERHSADAKLLSEIERRYTEGINAEKILNQERYRSFQKMVEDANEYTKTRFYSLEKQIDSLKLEIREDLKTMKNEMPDNSILTKSLKLPSFFAAIVVIVGMITGYYSVINPIREGVLLNSAKIGEISSKNSSDMVYLKDELKELRRLLNQKKLGGE